MNLFFGDQLIMHISKFLEYKKSEKVVCFIAMCCSLFGGLWFQL